MRLLADTNLFIKFCRRLPLPAGVESVLEDATTERRSDGTQMFYFAATFVSTSQITRKPTFQTRCQLG